MIRRKPIGAALDLYGLVRSRCPFENHNLEAALDIGREEARLGQERGEVAQILALARVLHEGQEPVVRLIDAIDGVLIVVGHGDVQIGPGPFGMDLDALGVGRQIGEIAVVAEHAQIGVRRHIELVDEVAEVRVHKDLDAVRPRHRLEDEFPHLLDGVLEQEGRQYPQQTLGGRRVLPAAAREKSRLGAHAQKSRTR